MSMGGGDQSLNWKRYGFFEPEIKFEFENRKVVAEGASEFSNSEYYKTMS
jgi:hypothetical protein